METLVLPEWIIQLAPIISIISDLLVAIAAIWGIRGLNQWRLQLKFGDQYKIAHSIRGLSLRFKREFGLIRNQAPLSLSVGIGITVSELMMDSQHLVNDFYTRKHHLDMLFGIADKLYNESIEVEGYLGEKEAVVTLPLENAYRKLLEAFRDYEQLIQSLESRTCDQEAVEKFQRSRHTLFSSDNDLLASQVDTAVKDIPQRLRRYLK